MPRNLRVIWFASDEHATSSNKIWGYEDQGTIEFDDGTLTFRGAGVTKLKLENIHSVELARQTISWPLLFTSIVITFVTTRILLVPWVTLPVSLFVAVFWFTELSRKWVKFSYETGFGYGRTIWLANGGCLGWEGIFGGTRKLHDILIGEAEPPAKTDQKQSLIEIAAVPNDDLGNWCVECEEYIEPDEDNRCPNCFRPI